jgi:hypothetical protein
MLYSKKPMKFEINFEHIPDYVLIRTEGEASVSGFREMLTSMVESPRWITGTHQIADHRKLLIKNLTANDIHKLENIVENLSIKIGGGCCAFVVNDSLGFGLARMYELSGGESLHSKVGVFYSINEAVEWLKNKCNSAEKPNNLMEN